MTNPPNPFESQWRELLEPTAPVSVTVLEDASREILSRNDGPDLPFRWSVNPYRGCFHACAYCYARPTHEYWGLGAGTDFDSTLIIKPEAPHLLRRAFLRPTWRGELIVFSGNTDCYQPLEAAYGLTKACLEVCAEFRNPVTIITKGALILRDLELLRELNRLARVSIFFSIPFADLDTARKMEPHAPSPDKRLETLRHLSEAGLSTGLSLAPVIPGLNDHDIPRILSRARAAGATDAFLSLLHLPGSAAPVFEERLAAAFPDRARKVWHRLEEVQRTRSLDFQIFSRREGQGTYWDSLCRLFEVTYRRLGFRPHDSLPCPTTFRRPDPAQGELFTRSHL